MTDSVRESIYEAIASIRLIDPHTHINPHSPASNTLADLLGYHYYTELAHSAGMPKNQIEEDGIPHRELVRRLVANLSPIENTAQYRWLIEICRNFFGFTGDRLDESNWEDVYDAAERQMSLAEWPQMLLDQSNVEAVFLTNDFDDDLAGFDTDTYIPCLRTDDLVFHLAKPQTRQRLEACSQIALDGSLTSLRESLRQRFTHFVGRGARACAISLPPTFEPTRVSDGRASTAWNDVLQHGPNAAPSQMNAISRSVFWTLAELCDEFGLPFDLMIGVNRGVYADGVFQGQDLYDSRVSLIQYRELFNAFPQVKFPVSVLASVTNQELVSYAWIFPNVITNGHWWYSNTPSFIARDAAARLEAVPQTKQIAYYSDAYKLEFVWPKFDMYRHVLSGILADHFVGGNGWSEERAIELGRQVLRDNVDEIFPRPQMPASNAGAVDTRDGESSFSTVIEETATAADSWTLQGSDEELATSETVTLETVITDEAFEELDPLPSQDEIQSANVDDVQLSSGSAETSATDAESLESAIDAEPLDVGDVTGEEDAEGPEIRMLRGEGSFEPDEDSLQVRPDPVTGELKFPVADDEDPNSTQSGE
ncbi:MAG: glucuronate isomerase [Rubripirellula sp.]